MARNDTARGFREVDIGNVGSQQATDRYGGPSGELPDYPPWASFDDNGDQLQFPDDGDFLLGWPYIALWRLNLVALSQRDNLYFTAYRAQVHVTIPRNVKHILPPRSDLVIKLPVSKQALEVGGYINPEQPHNVNHMIVGNLGEYEILLVSCDDGDVLAYYTQAVGEEIRSSSHTPVISITKPFFHENVGISAWGLAIHQESRLIAVSSNRREVTVFVFALENKIDESLGMVDETALTEDEMFPVLCRAYLHSSRNRYLGYRRILKVGPDGDNIPSIAFSNECNGDPQSVIASDIKGNLWFLAIWDDDKKCLPSLYSMTETLEDRPMGWGVLVLPLRDFKRTSTALEALGALPQDLPSLSSHEQSLDISATIRRVRDASVWHPAFGYDIHGPDEDSDAESLAGLAIERELEISTTALIAEEDGDDNIGMIEDGIDVELEAADKTRAGVDCLLLAESRLHTLINSKPRDDEPTRIKQQLAERCKDFKSRRSMPETRENSPRKMFFLPDNSAILRTHKYDVELHPPTCFMRKTICKNVLKQRMPETLHFPIQQVDRLNMVESIPELSLVVVASQAGRAALLTLTRPEDSFSENGPVTMFRLDLIVPFKHQEDEDLRPEFPLLGMAVSPLPLGLDGMHGNNMERRKSSRRFRLILHYYDHTILSYELSREDETNDLLVL